MRGSSNKEFEKLSVLLKLSPEDREQWRQLIKNEKRALEYQSGLRGKYLSAFASLESNLEEAIATHFCTEEAYQNMLCSWVLATLPFRRKTEILKRVLKCYDDSMIQRTNKNMPNLRDINDFRNELAHLEPDLRDSYTKKPTDRTRFHLLIRDGAEIKRKEITKEAFEKKLEEVKHASTLLRLVAAYMRRPCEDRKKLNKTVYSL